MSESTPWEVNIYQIFEQASDSIKRLDDYGQVLESKKPLPAGYRIIQATDEHIIVRAGGALIEVLENRYHIDSPRWWWPRGWKFYKRIRNHCKRARELEKSMRTKDVTDRWQELTERGSKKISVMPLTAGQIKRISTKLRELLSEAESATLMFEQYRKATQRNGRCKQIVLTEDLDNIERQVNEAVKVIDSATSFRKPLTQPCRLPPGGCWA
jgi:hypothetical protein